jgi:hypothetical protein
VDHAAARVISGKTLCFCVGQAPREPHRHGDATPALQGPEASGIGRACCAMNTANAASGSGRLYR